MNRWTLWGLLLGVLLGGCAASDSALREAEKPEALRVEVRFAEKESCLVLLCDQEEVCGFFRCEAVAEVVATTGPGEEVAPGQVVKTWANPGGVSSSSPMRYWGGPVPLPKQKSAVFVIPWKNHHLRNLLPSQQQQQEEADEKLNRPHEKHHIFSQAFKKWFESKGIDIHQWTMLIETTLHKSIHRGPNGGPWNAAWAQFIEANRNNIELTKEEIWKYAGELCVRFGLMAPLQPYYGGKRLPPPIEF